MSYDITAWVGQKPADEAGLKAEYERVQAELAASPDAAPVGEVEHFVSLLIKRWPDVGQPGDDASPWAGGPVLDGASGSAIRLALKDDGLDVTLPFIAEAADRLGLVAYDVQKDAQLSA